MLSRETIEMVVNFDKVVIGEKIYEVRLWEDSLDMGAKFYYSRHMAMDRAKERHRISGKVISVWEFRVRGFTSPSAPDLQQIAMPIMIGDT